MKNELKDHFILLDKCAEETRIVEIQNKKIAKFTCWQDDKPPLIGRTFDALILKKLNSGIIRAMLSNKKIVSVRVGTKSLKINDKIKIIIMSEEFDGKPLQAKLLLRKSDFENLSDVQRIIHLFFKKDLTVIEDNYAVYWNKLDLDTQFQNALQSMVKMDDGGFLSIEKTKAATLIDVDTKDLLIKNEDEMLKFCKNTFVKCMDEIKLRNIGGMILIDFPRMPFIKKKNLHEFIIKEGTKKIQTVIF